VAVTKYPYNDPEEGIDFFKSVDDQIRGKKNEDHGTEGKAKKEQLIREGGFIF